MNRRFCNGMVHVIKEGENLYQLSRAYRVPLALLLRANPYVDVYNLQVGQEICIPVARPFGGMMRPPMGRPGRPGRPQEAMPQSGMSMPDEGSDAREEREERLEEERERLEEERERMEEEREHREEMERREAEERRDIPEMMEQAEEEKGTYSHVSDGTKSFGAILRENGMTPEMFFAINDPNQITIAADVIYELPKKV